MFASTRLVKLVHGLLALSILVATGSSATFRAADLFVVTTTGSSTVNTLRLANVTSSTGNYTFSTPISSTTETLSQSFSTSGASSSSGTPAAVSSTQSVSQSTTAGQTTSAANATTSSLPTSVSSAASTTTTTADSDNLLVWPVLWNQETTSVTYTPTRVTDGDVGPTPAWKCMGPLCDTSCVVVIFCDSSEWGVIPGVTVLPSTPGGTVPGSGPPSPADGDGDGEEDGDDDSEPSCTTVTSTACDTTYSVFTPDQASTATTSIVTGTCATETACSPTAEPHITTITSSSTCSQSTATACDISYSVFTPSGSTTATTSTITGDCSTVTACSATLTWSTITTTSSCSASTSEVCDSTFTVYVPEGASEPTTSTMLGDCSTSVGCNPVITHQLRMVASDWDTATLPEPGSETYSGDFLLPGQDLMETSVVAGNTSTTVLETSTTVSTSVPTSTTLATTLTAITSSATSTEMSSLTTTIDGSSSTATETPSLTTTIDVSPSSSSETSSLTTTIDVSSSTPTTSVTTSSASVAPPLCYNHGGPNVPTPYCQCETTTAGQTFFATATLISGQCVEYTSFPSAITLAPTTAASTTTAPPVPYIETESNGDVLSYPSQTVRYGEVADGVQVTMTEGLGVPVTIATPLPTQTDNNLKGSGTCKSIDDACDRAFLQYVDDTVYTDYTAYVAQVWDGMLPALTFNEAGCTAMFKCDDYGIGMKGVDIKNAVWNLKDNYGLKKCGTTYLSNSCQITLNYCVSCKATQ